MGRKVTRYVITADKDGNRMELAPGDDVPAGVHVDDEYTTEGSGDPSSTVIPEDVTRTQLLNAAKRVGLKGVSNLSRDQIAHAVRERLFNQAAPEDGQSDEALRLAEAENASGNVNALPTGGESSARSVKGKPTGGAGGAGS